jgi:hypothetical protein
MHDIKDAYKYLPHIDSMICVLDREGTLVEL